MSVVLYCIVWWCWWWSCRDDLLRVLLRVSVLSFSYLLLSLLYSTVDSNYSFDPILSSVLFETTSFSHPRICQSIFIMKHHPPTRFYSPPRNVIEWKMWFLYLNTGYLRIFAGFLPIKTSNMNRFGNGFQCRIASSKLYNNAAQSLSRHELGCMKIIIETFLGENRFPCVSSVVFEAI